MLSKTPGSTEISYEVHSIERHNIFITLAIVFFFFSFIAGEIDLNSGIKKFSKAQNTLLITAGLLLFTSCSPKFNDGKLLFEGKLDWNRKDYQGATACFLEASDAASKRGDITTKEYALCNLATTYLMQDENDIALKRFAEILENTGEDTSPLVKFTALYNSGIISHRQGNYRTAADFFKAALLIDNSSIEAKINLELSLQETASQNHNSEESEITPASEHDYDQSLENAIYSIIKEEEQNQWKSMQQQTTGSALDY